MALDGVEDSKPAFCHQDPDSLPPRLGFPFILSSHRCLGIVLSPGDMVVSEAELSLSLGANSLVVCKIQGTAW